MSILTEFQGQRITQDYFDASASQLTEKILAAKKRTSPLNERRRTGFFTQKIK